MRTTKYLLATLKENPKNSESISYQLMLRAGLIRKISSGLYIWLPTGLRILKKIKDIIREEMNKIGALEISMPIVQPAELWKKSGRWLEYGKELLRFANRNNQEFILGPTHEEIISNFICKETISYKKFPLNLYQIHTKYRDEARPRSGVIRAREFLMKDGYSFHVNKKSLQDTYLLMYKTYCTIFNRIGLIFYIIKADPGKIGGTLSHEFQAVTFNKIKKTICLKKTCKNNIELKKNTHAHIKEKNFIKENLRLIDAPQIHNINELIKKFKLSIKQVIKIIVVHTNKKYRKISDNNLFALIIRADHQLNYKKAEKLPQISNPLSIASVEEVRIVTGTHIDSLGPINLKIPLIIDYHVAQMNNFISGANIEKKYFFGINWIRDIPLPKIADLSNIPLNIHIDNNILKRKNDNIEIGHIFQLGEKYSKITCIHTKKNKKDINLQMGCYGIGITRIIAACIEQNYDKHGILWPISIAPFKIAIIPINMYNFPNVRKISEELYNKLSSIIGSDILIDDRKENPGIMFSEMDLIGIPHIIIISNINLNKKEIEYKNRYTGIIQKIKLHEILNYLKNKILKKT